MYWFELSKYFPFLLNVIIVGPFSSVLVNRFSCRFTLITGGMTMFTGFILSYFAVDSLDFLLLTYGIIAGKTCIRQRNKINSKMCIR